MSEKKKIYRCPRCEVKISGEKRVKVNKKKRCPLCYGKLILVDNVTLNEGGT